jgi:phage-related protein
MDGGPKPLVWVAASKKDFLAFPKAVVQDVGHALYLAQCGDKPPNAKPLKGFSGAGVLEVVEKKKS